MVAAETLRALSLAVLLWAVAAEQWSNTLLGLLGLLGAAGTVGFVRIHGGCAPATIYKSTT